MWNLGIPAILKAYLDYVSVSGITFQYTENGRGWIVKREKSGAYYNSWG